MISDISGSPFNPVFIEASPSFTCIPFDREWLNEFTIILQS